MNLYDLNSDNIIMNIDGKDIEMKPAICYGKVYDKWLVSKCGKIWSGSRNRLITGCKNYQYSKEGKRLREISLSLATPSGFWEDGSGYLRYDRPGTGIERKIRFHKVVIDTWAPLYDNPPEGISRKEWEIARELDTIYDYFNKSGSIDHIDDDPANNHLDNLRRVNDWDNQKTRKAKGI